VSAASGTFVADLSGLVVRFRGLDEPLAGHLAAAWAPFSARPDATPWLDVELECLSDPIATDRPMRPSVTGEVREGSARFRSDEGRLVLDAQGLARVALGRGDARWRYWGLLNLIAAAVAVRLPSRPGALLHGAGIVLDDRAFVLIGPEGTGKSTFAQKAKEGGARVIGDDAVIVDGMGGGLSLLGSPVRAHEATQPGPGRWPVAAVLHARRGSTPRLDVVGRLAIEALVTANLPFLASGWGHDARLDALVPYLATAAPHRALTFAPDSSFVEVLRAF